MHCIKIQSKRICLSCIRQNKWNQCTYGIKDSMKYYFSTQIFWLFFGHKRWILSALYSHGIHALIYTRLDYVDHPITHISQVLVTDKFDYSISQGFSTKLHKVNGNMLSVWCMTYIIVNDSRFLTPQCSWGLNGLPTIFVLHNFAQNEAVRVLMCNTVQQFLVLF